MRRTPAVALLSLILITSPARAEFPAALSAWGGAGLGSGHREEVGDAGSFGLLGVEAAWRFSPGRALVATAERAGLFGRSYFPEGSYLAKLEHFAITVGPELSFPPGSRLAFFCRASAGIGRVTTTRSGYVVYTGIPGPAALTENGFALSGAAGLRLMLPPGPLGFTIALHAARITADNSNCGGIGLTAGLTLYPLNRRPAPPGR